MAFEIVRKKRFLNRLTKVLDFLQNEWGVNVAVDFLNKTDKKIDLIRQYPHIGLPSGIRDTRSLLVTKHNRLFYRVVKNRVIILNLYDTRKRPKNQ